MSRLNMDFTDKEDKMIEDLKEEYGFSKTTELIRYLLTKQIKENLK